MTSLEPFCEVSTNGRMGFADLGKDKGLARA